MRGALLIPIVLLVGCASTQEDGQTNVYGVAEAWIVSGPTVERYETGKTVCKNGTVENPCRASYAGGWEPFAAAINSVLDPLSRVATSGVAMLLGRDEVPTEFEISEANTESRFEDSGDIEVNETGTRFE